MSNKTVKQNIPKEWKDIAVSSILDVRDGTHDTPPKADRGVPLITSKNIVNGSLNTSAFSCVSKEDAEQINKRSKVEKGDILISMIGTVGECALLKENPEFVVKNVGIFKKNEDQIVSEYLIKYLHSNLSQHRVRSRSNGGIQKFISLGDLRKLNILLPPLPEQKRIVKVLETWDEAIEKMNQTIELKREVKKGLMQKLLTGELRLPGFKGDWTTSKVSDLGHLFSGGTPSKKNKEFWSGNVPWISSSDLDAEDILNVKISRFITDEAIKQSATKLIPSHSVVMVSRVGVGKLIVNSVPLCTSQDFQSLVFDVEKKTDPYFLAFLLSLELKKFIQRNQGTSIKGFLKTDLEKLHLRLPELTEQEALSQLLLKLENELALLKKKKVLYEDQKKYLLNNLVTGQIRTPENL